MLSRISIGSSFNLRSGSRELSSVAFRNRSLRERPPIRQQHKQHLLRRYVAYCSEQHVGSFRELVPSRTLGADGTLNGLASSKLVTRPSAFYRRGTDPSRRRMFHSSTQHASLPEHQVVAMPALSPTMESGSIAKWNLKEGDAFEVGTSICEVETDKATVSFDATDDGFIAKILVREGEIKVGQPIMVTCEDAADVAAFKDFAVDAAAPAVTSAAAPAPTPDLAPAAATAQEPAPTVPLGSVDTGDRVFASPFARKMAREAGISIDEVAQRLGSDGGIGGRRIVAADVMRAASMAAVASHTTAPATASSAAAPPTPSVDAARADGVYTDFVMGDAALSLAARTTHAKQVVPHYYLSVDLNLEELLKVRASFNTKSAETELSVQDFIVKAAAMAMQQVPDVNGAWMDTFVRRYHQVDINLVMGAGNFVATPVLKNVGTRGLLSIAKETAAFEEQLFDDDSSVSAGSVGTFSIHNLGMFGVKSAAPIVLTPQACALSLGAIIDTVVPDDADDAENNWKVAPVMTVTLSCDHRVVDGAVGAQWLASLKSFVESPMSMLL